MATWPLKSVLQLQVFIIVYQATFLAAQFHGYPSAQNSKLWMNNNFSAVYITKPYSSDTSGPIMRIFLLNPSGFACGFLSDGGTGSFFLGIASVGANYYTKKEILSDVLVFWVANRNRPVHENATLELVSEGDLVLRDADGTPVCSTHTSNMSVVGMRVMETGNLVLYDRFNTTVWQSFDHPTDTLLPGQKLMEGQKLVARVSPTNWTEGNFYLSVTSQGLFAYYNSQIPQMYFNYSVRETSQITVQSYVKSVNGSLALCILSSEPNKADAVFLDPFNSTVRYVRLDSNGYLRAYGGKNGPVDLLAEFLKECDYPTVCGNFGICSNGQCGCPERAGYEKGVLNFTDVQGDPGCADPSPTACQKNPPYQEMVEFEDHYYFNYVDTDAAVLKGTNAEKCKQQCIDNCSCKAVFFHYIHKPSDGSCFLPSSVLSITTDLHQWQFYVSSAFIKFSTDLYSESFDGSQILLIIAMAVSSILIMYNVYGSCKKRDKEELDGEDQLDQVSGLPVRFSYEGLKVATGNFHKKLGQGGFGSVFEGSLVNGEKIAVKRLDPLGQGKKEFLAEVKTIGSIHHVKLARLIGFCAEKLDRLLVYEFMSNGSLDKWIFRKNPQQPPLDWQTRRTIILDIARGLAYLHEECRRKIVHFDIKPQNILLDEHFNAKISDFGLSKLIDRDQSQVVTTMKGTRGYLAPEWFGSIITTKVDVYAFGIVVMEIVCGRKNLDLSQPEEYMHLLSLFMKKAEENQLIDLVDQVSEDMQVHGSEAVEMMRLAVWCLQRDFNRRPSMSIVVKVIQGDMEIEVDLDYSISITTTMPATRREAELGIETTLLPSILSGPR